MLLGAFDISDGQLRHWRAYWGHFPFGGHRDFVYATKRRERQIRSSEFARTRNQGNAGIIARMTMGSRALFRISYLVSLFAILSSLSIFSVAIAAAQSSGAQAEEEKKDQTVRTAKDQQPPKKKHGSKDPPLHKKEDRANADGAHDTSAQSGTAQGGTAQTNGTQGSGGET